VTPERPLLFVRPAARDRRLDGDLGDVAAAIGSLDGG
jgi:hypothetical protein